MWIQLHVFAVFRGAFAQRNVDKLTEICTKRSDSVSYDATAVISTLR